MEKKTVTRLTFPEAEPTREGFAPLPATPEEDTLTVRRLFGVLRRRVILIAGIAFLVTSLATLFVYQITPLYRAGA